MGRSEGGARPHVTYAIIVAPAARRQLRKLDPVARRRIQAAIDLLAENPRPPAAKRLVNFTGEWRVRIGDYRIVYDIEDDQLVVLVLSAGHRREIYNQ
jgi:mRNA interferase RelE/StbE